jgi:hypothetical protein
VTREDFDTVTAFVWNSVCAIENVEGADRPLDSTAWLMRLLVECGKTADECRYSGRRLTRLSRIAAIAALAMHRELSIGCRPDLVETVR